MNRRTLTAVSLAALTLAGCRPLGTTGPVMVTTPTVVTSTTTTPEPGPAAAPFPPVSRPSTVRDELAKLTIDDRPYTGPDYRREDWPHWLDLDHNGCDARKDALIAASLDKPHVARGCKVTAGRWSLVYTPGETTDPGQVDVDHVVPLGNAGRSGGGSWSPDQRAAYANDQAVLWVVDDGANQAKGDRSPDQWRPAVRDVWCTYAHRWIAIKTRPEYRLTATSAERDALGEMLDTCPR